MGFPGMTSKRVFLRFGREGWVTAVIVDHSQTVDGDVGRSSLDDVGMKLSILMGIIETKRPTNGPET